MVYAFGSGGVKLLIDMKVDERLSDTDFANRKWVMLIKRGCYLKYGILGSLNLLRVLFGHKLFMMYL